LGLRSAVDAEVGRQLWDKCINGILGNKIRVLVTHQVQFLKSANRIILLGNGRIELEGTYDNVMIKGLKAVEAPTPHSIPSPYGLSSPSLAAIGQSSGPISGVNSVFLLNVSTVDLVENPMLSNEKRMNG
jgi:ATP-binding cassette subfamily C (CFTR/MRP) protein 4